MRKAITVSSPITVGVDESKFTPEFMEAFRKNFFDFDTVQDHMEYLATLYVENGGNFAGWIEGYGDPNDFGITFEEWGPNVTEVEDA